jgi:hypothetical protein
MEETGENGRTANPLCIRLVELERRRESGRERRSAELTRIDCGAIVDGSMREAAEDQRVRRSGSASGGKER